MCRHPRPFYKGLMPTGIVRGLNNTQTLIRTVLEDAGEEQPLRVSPFHCCNKIPEENRLEQEALCIPGPVVRQNLTAGTWGREGWLTSEPLGG